MSITTMNAQALYGLFELDPNGTVIYSRVEPDGGQPGPPPDLSGLNFYDLVGPFGDVEEFRRQVTQFLHGESPAESFRFKCRADEEERTVKVLLARIRERMSGDSTKSVLVHIRKDIRKN